MLSRDKVLVHNCEKLIIYPKNIDLISLCTLK